MNILVIDAAGACLSWLMECKKAGHEIRWYVSLTKEKKHNPVGEGIIKRVSSWKPHMDWADLIFLTDNTKCIEELESYHRAGYPIFGPNKAGTALELDRQVGQDAFAAADIPVMEGDEFKDYDTAIKYVMANTDKRFVSKPSGDADKALSYVSSGADDMVFMLEMWKKLGKNKAPFILQEFKPGIEMAVGGWFGKNGWGKWFCENFEHKKLMSGNYGPNTGEQGTVLRYCTDSYLADVVLQPLTKMLKKIGYVGYLDVAVIIDENGCPWPLEFTCRPGWPCFVIQCAMHLGDPAQWMVDLLNGEDTLDVDEDIVTGVVVPIPDYPYGNKPIEELQGFPIYCDDNMWLRHVHPCEMKMGVAPAMDGDKVVKEHMLVSAGNYLVVVTGIGTTVKSASKDAYKHIKQLRIPSSPLVRDDIGERLEKELPILQECNIAEGWDYS